MANFGPQTAKNRTGVLSHLKPTFSDAQGCYSRYMLSLCVNAAVCEMRDKRKWMSLSERLTISQCVVDVRQDGTQTCPVDLSVRRQTVLPTYQADCNALNLSVSTAGMLTLIGKSSPGHRRTYTRPDSTVMSSVNVRPASAVTGAIRYTVCV